VGFKISIPEIFRHDLNKSNPGSVSIERYMDCSGTVYKFYSNVQSFCIDKQINKQINPTEEKRYEQQVIDFMITFATLVS